MVVLLYVKTSLFEHIHVLYEPSCCSYVPHKYPLNPRSVSGEEAESQFSRWPTCHRFNKFVST